MWEKKYGNSEQNLLSSKSWQSLFTILYLRSSLRGRVSREKKCGNWIAYAAGRVGWWVYSFTFTPKKNCLIFLSYTVIYKVTSMLPGFFLVWESFFFPPRTGRIHNFECPQIKTLAQKVKPGLNGLLRSTNSGNFMINFHWGIVTWSSMNLSPPLVLFLLDRNQRKLFWQNVIVYWLNFKPVIGR